MASTFPSNPQPRRNIPVSNFKWCTSHSGDHRLRDQPNPTHVSPMKNDRLKLGVSGEKSKIGFASFSPAKNERRLFKLPYPSGGSSISKRKSEFDGEDDPGNRSIKRGLADFAAKEVIEESLSKAVAAASALDIPEKKSEGGGCFVVNREHKSVPSDPMKKIFIRFGTKNEAAVEAAEAEKEKQRLTEAEEMVPKTWNLRPRRSNAKGGSPAIAGMPEKEALTRSQTGPSRAKTGVAAKNKIKFLLSLSNEEIEEDIWAFTGSKPSRRPKKRSRVVQRQLDCLFPGTWLSSVTLDSYRADPPLKG